MLSESSDSDSDTQRRRTPSRKLRVFNTTYQPDEVDSEFDYIFLVVHGASFSTQLLANNMTDFLKTIEEVKKTWFWEISMKIHVEMIDWKSAMAPYQNSVLTRLSPVIVEAREEETITRAESAPANPQKGQAFDRLLSLVGLKDEKAETTRAVKIDREDAKTGEACMVSDNIREFQELSRKHGPRLYFTNTVADILSYMTPRHGNYMTREIARLLNNRVASLRQDPSGKFAKAKIILIGHSLGSVVLYDILTRLPCRMTADPDPDRTESVFPGVKVPPSASEIPPSLNFRVSHYFMWGSPVGAFLALANRTLDVPTQSTRIYNIFHRSDPVAMRIEPLLYPSVNPCPPPIILPNYKTNAAADSTLKRGLELMNQKNPFRAVAAQVSRYLSQVNQDPLESVPLEKRKWYVKTPRYHLPDPVRKSTRFGRLTQLKTSLHEPTSSRVRDGVSETPCFANEESGQCKEKAIDETAAFQGEFIGTPLKLAESPDPSSSETPGSSTINLTDTVGKASPQRSPNTQARATEEDRPEAVGAPVIGVTAASGATFDVGKGDAADPPESIDSLMMVDFYCEGIPWTRRQLTLLLSEKLRTRASSLLETLLSEMQSEDTEKMDQMRSAAFTMIDLAVEEFIKSVVPTSSKTKTTRKLTPMNMDRMTWLRKSRKYDKKATADLCEAEVRTELQREMSEVEIAPGDQLLARLDFAVAESIHEYILVPLGLLQSHMAYWSCHDAILFMLKEISDFRPRLTREQKDVMLAEAEKSLTKLKSRIVKLVPSHSA